MSVLLQISKGINTCRYCHYCNRSQEGIHSPIYLYLHTGPKMIRSLIIQLLLQAFLYISDAQADLITIPWMSSSLAADNVFIVLIGDTLKFNPCGDSDHTNLVYTNSKQVFDDCIPRNNISADVIYNSIGDCVNPSGQLILPVNTGIIGVNFVAFEINGTFYFLSNHENECERGLKAIVEVVETRPSVAPTDSGPGMDVNADGDDHLSWLPLHPALIIVSLAGWSVMLFVTCLVFTALCCMCNCRKNRKTTSFELESQPNSKSPLEQSHSTSSVEIMPKAEVAGISNGTASKDSQLINQLPLMRGGHLGTSVKLMTSKFENM